MQAPGRMSADEMILANGAAEAAQTEALKQIIAENDASLTQIREVNDLMYKDIHDSVDSLGGSVGEVHTAVQDVQAGVQDVQSGVQNVQAGVQDVQSGVQNVQAGVQDVQAAVQSVTAGVGDVQSGVQDVHTAVLGVQDAIGGFGSAMEEFYSSVDEGREKIFAQMARSDEAAHRDSVRVYRNVQASMITELGKQTKELNAEISALTNKLEQTRAELKKAQEEASAKRHKVSSPLLLFTFAASIAALALEILEVTGLIGRLMSFFPGL